MTDMSDYETLLRSMSALSQQFSTQRKCRTVGTPPNPVLNSRRSRSRVAKPKSTTASPLNAAAYRRRAASSQQPSAVPQSTATFNPAPQAGATLSGTQDFFVGSSSDYDRPRSWHADMQPPSSWAMGPQPFLSAMPDAYLQMQMNVPGFNPTSLGHDVMYPSMSNSTWFSSQQEAAEAYSTSHMLFLPGSNVDAAPNAVQLAPQSSTQPLNSMFGDEQTQQYGDGEESIISDEDAESEEDGELVGMGLYDKTTRDDQPPSLLLGAGLEEDEATQPWGKGLQLEETWAPSAEQVPDAEPDNGEGSDTPVTVDFQSWAPMDGHDFNVAQDAFTTEASDIYTTPYAEVDARLPHVMGTNFVYDDDGSLISDEMLGVQHKMSATLNWFDDQWLYYPQQGYYNQHI